MKSLHAVNASNVNTIQCILYTNLNVKCKKNFFYFSVISNAVEHCFAKAFSWGCRLNIFLDTNCNGFAFSSWFSAVYSNLICFNFKFMKILYAGKLNEAMKSNTIIQPMSITFQV